ncbi:MAG: DUF348 domain-containing protein [Candidatus Desulforudis sp.]|nr:DUF348 domain-containing protein [Desulforudis sp.]
MTSGNEERKARARVRRTIVGLIVFLLLSLGLTPGVYAWAKMNVIIEDDGELFRVRVFRGGTVADVLERERIGIGDWDRVSPVPESVLYDGIRISIRRAVPVVVRVDGREWEEWTTARTVDCFLKEAGVKLNDADLVRPSRWASLTEGMEVSVARVTTVVEEQEVRTAHGVERRPAYDMLKGRTKVLAQGEDGVVRETWRVVYHDGDELRRELVSCEVLSKPRSQVLLVGMADTVSRGGQEIRFERSFQAVATAYTYTGNNTATGKPPGPGTVAVDPRVIPLGTRLYIDGYGYGTAMDIGRSIKGERIDVFFTTPQEALRWGRRTVNVYVLD